MNAMEQLKTWIDDSDNIVFFGGTGASAKSGIPDFRSEDGLYRQQYQYPPEAIISHNFCMEGPKKFYRLYKNRMIFENAKLNPVHLALAGLEKQGKLKAVITQDIGDLHQAAGSREVLELHGSIHRNYCTRCGKFYGFDVVTRSDEIPRCNCGGIVKSDMVLYEEGLGQETLQKAMYHISHADMLIVSGTSLAVYPVTGLIDYYKGRKLVLINKTVTPMDSQADLVINDKLREVFGSVVEEL